ncbi:MAG: endopeptidase La [Bdellovibrionota bacterium]
MKTALPAEYIPVVAIRQTVLFPGVSMPLRINRPKSIAALERSQEKGWPILFVSQQAENEDEPFASHLYKVGTLCRIEKIKGSKKSGYQILVRGLSRFRINDYAETDGMISAQGQVWDDDIDVDEPTRIALLDSLKTVAQDILSLLPTDVQQLSEMLSGIEELGFLTHIISANLDLPLPKRQALLETISVKARALTVLEILQERKTNLKVQSEIREKLSEKFGKQQRDHILREQLRTIREELGEGGGEGDDKKASYKEKIEKAGMPAEVKKIALDEAKRLEDIGNSPEAHVIRNYLDLLCAMPWDHSAAEQIDLVHARAVLEADHHGLEKIKKRVMQHLAVMKLLASKPKPVLAEGEAMPLGKDGKRGSILLFVGPPGVGKTSLGQSIARALGRKFVRVSLGGVRDDSEIRGHRRTYIGAMPGRVVQGIKRAGENNPVMMLDEIDKLGAGYQGDPAAALLEVLDPEQNSTFTDHYLDVPFDLSKVFFIATANTLETIPGPLLDRMEVIELGGYTTAEKFHIAQTHLIPKQLSEHGMDEGQLVIDDDTLKVVINEYTREAGVRNLQRKIATICRASTERVLATDAILPIHIRPEDLDEVLGPQRYTHEVAEQQVPPGVVTGLAWTPVGGEILFVESSLMPGSGRLILTGQLGEVMKESAQIALSLVRSRLPLAVGVGETDKRDVHVHVPAGAIPKDGPSAGVALTTALASLYLGKSVDPKTAMTGEVTLRGMVMPVGGIKEKVIAAHRAGITKILLARQNEKDLRDVPAEVKRDLQFTFVDTISDVFKEALGVDTLQYPFLPKAAPGTSSQGVAGVA